MRATQGDKGALERLSRKVVERYTDQTKGNFPERIPRDSIMEIRVNEKGDIFINNPNSVPTVERDLSKLKAEIKDFIINRGGWIAFKYDRATQYRDFRAVNDAIMKTYYQVRNDYALKHYGKMMGEMTDTEREAVEKAIPYRIYRYE